ncbi:MAG TPA: SH3 domain-containing protein, partial [Longimicrobium sp.]|nr:SH3 domain-containing protein [Longimicrobium sp.]
MKWMMALAAALLLAAPATAQTKLMPVDQASRDPSFLRFRAQLVDAVQRRDAAFVYRILAPDITNSFGDTGGIDEFKETWDAGHPASKLWNTLGELLALGGAFDGDSSFVAPYVYSRWPEGYDGFEYGAIVGSDVRVRGRPFLGAPIIAALSYDVVPMANERGSNGWEAIRLPDGRTGYIATRYVRRPIDYRA